MQILGQLYSPRKKHLICFSRILCRHVIQIDIHVPGDVQIAVDVLFPEEILQGLDVRVFEVGDFDARVEPVARDVGWDVSVDVGAEVSAWDDKSELEHSFTF